MSRFRRGVDVALHDIQETSPVTLLAWAILAFVVAYAIFYITGAYL